jgi:hypothetical protein
MSTVNRRGISFELTLRLASDLADRLDTEEGL